jgi:cysteine desulfurase
MLFNAGREHIVERTRHGGKGSVIMSVRSYLDHNATSPLRPEARDAMMAAMAYTGNPSSVHADGREAHAAVENARETVARVFQVKPQAVTFTSGGTEAANWLLQAWPGRKLAVSAVEHPCVQKGHRFPDEDVSVVPVSSDGVIDLEELEKALASPAIVAVQAANNETGVIQPLSDVASLTKNGFVVCDAVQMVGRVPLRDLSVAGALFFSAHKFGGPKGIGAVIWQSAEPEPAPLIRGGGQESRRRSGTENVVGIAGLAAALDAADKEQVTWKSRAEALQLKLEQGLRVLAPDAVIFGENAERLPNTTCFAIPGKSAETLLIAFDLEGTAISSGSACSSGKAARSHVLAAMGVKDSLGEGVIRVSTGWNTEDADIERFLAALEKICRGRAGRRAA